MTVKFTATELDAMDEAIEARLAGETDIEVNKNALESASAKVNILTPRRIVKAEVNEPVAWRFRRSDRPNGWWVTVSKEDADNHPAPKWIVEALYQDVR